MKLKLSLFRKFVAPTPARSFNFSIFYLVLGFVFLFLSWFFLRWELLIPVGVCVLYAFVLQFRVDYAALALDNLDFDGYKKLASYQRKPAPENETMKAASLRETIENRDLLKNKILDMKPDSVQYQTSLKVLQGLEKKILGLSVEIRLRKKK